MIQMKYRCLILDKIHPDGVNLIKKYMDTKEIESISTEDLAKEIAGYDALLMRVRPAVTKEVIDNADKLKVIGIGSIGLDHLDKAYAESKGIKVYNVPGGNSDSVAEMTIGHMIYMLRGAYKAVKDVKSGIWDRSRYESHQLGGKTVGLVALGAIGRRVAEFLNVFHANVLAYDPFISEEDAQKINVKKVTLEQLLKESDIISVHAPLTPATRHMISAEQISMMKQGSYIVNMSRGGVVDNDSLYDALKSGKLAGAAADVMEVEPCYKSPLYELDNFVITPHFAGVTVEAQQKIGKIIANKILQELNIIA